MADYFDAGPYPDDWSQKDRDLWDSEPSAYRANYENQLDYERAQNAFDRAFIWHGHHDKEYYDAAREEFYDASGMTPATFDWEAYREYIESIDTGNMASA